MTEVVIHCSVCGTLLQGKWFKVTLHTGEEALGGFKSGEYGICRPCFLRAMGVEPNGKTTDAEEVREVSASRPKHIRTRRTAVTRADIDSYRRSARADRSRKRKAAGRASGKPVSTRPGEDGRQSPALPPLELGELPSSRKLETDGSDDKEV